MSKVEELVNILNTCINNNNEVCIKIAKKRQEISDYRTKFLVAKTTGTTLGGIGAFGLALAPFTGGTSLAVSLIAGLAGTVTGVGVNLITDLVNSKETKEFISDLNSFNSSRNDHLKRLTKLMEELSEKIQAHVKEGASMQDSIGLGLREFAGYSGFNDGKMKAFSMATKFAQVEFSLAKAVLSNAKLVEVFAKSIQMEIPALKLLDLSGKGLNIAKGALKGVGVVAGVVFVAIDVGLLIKDFTSENEATDCAYKIEEQIESQTVTMKNLEKELRVWMQKMKRNEIERSDCSSSDDECICDAVKVSVLYCNMRSARPTSNNAPKLEKFKAIIASTRPQIIALVETWLTEQHSDIEIKHALGLEGYDIFRNDRADNRFPATNCVTDECEKRGGGMLVAWKNSPSFTETKLSFARELISKLVTSSNDNLQSYAITCSFNCGTCNRSRISQFSFRVVYRRPGPYTDQTFQDYQELDQAILSLLLDYYEGSGGIFLGGYRRGVVVGDFNWSNQKAIDIAKSIYKLGFVNIPGSTHQSGNSPDMILDFNGLVERPVKNMGEISDHSALYFNLKLGKDYQLSKSCEACK